MLLKSAMVMFLVVIALSALLMAQAESDDSVARKMATPARCFMSVDFEM